jgi:hypothetical protein
VLSCRKVAWVTYINLFIVTFDSISLTPWSRVIIEKMIDSQLIKKFPAVYGVRRFIPAHALNIYLTDLSFLMLFSYLHPNLPSGISYLDFVIGTVHAFIIYLIRATCPAHLTILDLITLKHVVKNTCYVAPYYASSCCFISLTSEYSLRTPFSDIRKVCSSLWVRNQVSILVCASDDLTL